MHTSAKQYDLNQRLAAVLRVVSDNCSINKIACELDLGWSIVNTWVRKYKQDGVEGLKQSHSWRKYSSDLKRAAVLDYLSGDFSLEECCRKYNISSHSVLTKWIHKYTSGKTLKQYQGGSTTMNKAKAHKTTYDERLMIVHDALAHDKDYQGIAAKYHVSYQQVYTWIRKYESQGAQGLEDNRGKKLSQRSSESLSETQRLQLQIQKLEREKKDLAVENFLLKKLHALGKSNKSTTNNDIKQ